VYTTKKIAATVAVMGAPVYAEYSANRA